MQTLKLESLATENELSGNVVYSASTGLDLESRRWIRLFQLGFAALSDSYRLCAAGRNGALPCGHLW